MSHLFCFQWQWICLPHQPMPGRFARSRLVYSFAGGHRLFQTQPAGERKLLREREVEGVFDGADVLAVAGFKCGIGETPGLLPAPARFSDPQARGGELGIVVERVGRRALERERDRTGGGGGE